jgi:hypothetical protein
MQPSGNHSGRWCLRRVYLSTVIQSRFDGNLKMSIITPDQAHILSAASYASISSAAFLLGYFAIYLLKLVEDLSQFDETIQRLDAHLAKLDRRDVIKKQR